MDHVSTNLPPAGWHPDPENPSGSVRWWDGSQWTAHVQPVTPMAAPTAWGNGGAAGPWNAAPQPSFARRNQASLTALVVAAIYAGIDLTSHVFILGIVPVMMAVRATRRRETMAPVAIVAAIIAVALAIIVR